MTSGLERRSPGWAPALRSSIGLASAALAHMLFGDVQFSTALALLVGAIPGVLVGAHLSSRAPDRVLRPLLVAILTASAMKLLDVPTGFTVVAVAIALVPAWAVFVRPTLQPRTQRAPIRQVASLGDESTA